jgi:drug/metabolite transporter (DMT)-like permease
MQLVSGSVLLFLSIQDLPRLLLYPLATAEAVVLGIVSLVGLLALYKGFQLGRLSIVSPIVSGFPALTSVLAVLLLGELLSSGRIVGIILTITGVILISIRQRIEHNGMSLPSGIPYAMLAFALFGVLYLVMKLVVPSLGVWVPVLMLRWVSAGLLGLYLLGSKRGFSVAGMGLGSFSLVISVAVLDTLGNILFNLGIVSGSVALVATLSGLFSAVTIGLAWVRLRERIEKHQMAGIFAVLGGVALIGYFG